MKLLPLLPAVLSVLLCLHVQAESPSQADAPQAAPAASHVNVYTVGKIDPAITARLKIFIERNAMLEMKLAGPIAPAGTQLIQQADSSTGQMDPGATLSILLTSEHKQDKGHAHINPSNRIAVVNVSPLLHAKQETSFRRLERQTTRAIGHALGLKPCPNPQCGLFPYRDLKELDNIGRGFCPPCQMLRDLNAKKQNITLRTLPTPGRDPEAKARPAKATPANPNGPQRRPVPKH